MITFGRFTRTTDAGLFFWLSFWIIIAATSAGTAHAAGYSIRQGVSGSALGNGLAGATSDAADISYMFFNPAGLTRQSGTQALLGATVLMPEARFEGGTATTSAGTPITASSADGDITPDNVVPYAYGMVSPTPDLRLGLGISVPWGLSTDHSSGWIGRYHALETTLQSVNINPAIAYRISPELSVGAGFQVQYLHGVLSNAIDVGTIGAGLGIPGSVPGAQDGHVELDADGWGYGYNLGVMFTPRPDTRIGIAYRSAVHQTLTGDADFTLDSSGIGATIAALGGGMTDGGADAGLVTPHILAFGVTHDLTPQWTVMAELDWIGWSAFNELRVHFDDPAQADDLTTANWNDTIYAAIGATYRPDSRWTLRGGIAFDQSPIPDATRNARIPDTDRIMLSAGASYRLSWVELAVSYAHMFLDDGDIDLTTAQPGNAVRGSLSGSFAMDVDVVSVQARFRF